MRFTKGHGTANDFVVIPDPDDQLRLDNAQVARICDRRTGVGADGILRVVRHDGPTAEWFMDYRNADGGAVEMCGNGIRVFARYLVDSGLATGTHHDIATRDGIKHVDLNPDGSVTVDMGPARDVAELGDGSVYVSMGNPHLVRLVDDPDNTPVSDLGPRLAATRDDGANVEFVHVDSETAVRARVWERGVGETHSCGTGACAIAVATSRLGHTKASVDVTLPGGTLHVEVADDRVLLTGPAVLVAEGELRDEWLTTA